MGRIDVWVRKTFQKHTNGASCMGNSAEDFFYGTVPIPGIEVRDEALGVIHPAPQGRNLSMLNAYRII